MGNHRSEVAHICLNGHVTGLSAAGSPQVNRRYCTECGEVVISCCPRCSFSIPGFRGADGQEFKIPNFCHHCGIMYPRTEKTLRAAEELADLIDGLDEDEAEELKATFTHLMADNPQSQLAAVKFLRLVGKGENVAALALRNMMVHLMVDRVKSMFSDRGAGLRIP